MRVAPTPTPRFTDTRRDVHKQNICLKNGEIWRRVFSNKIIKRLSHTVCCLLYSDVLLGKFTIKRSTILINSHEF